MKRNWPVIAFWLIAVAGCFVSEFGLSQTDFFIKPLLIPLLIFWLFWEIPAGRVPLIMVAGLIFSWMGDVFLMFEKSNSIFFILGLASFLITHLLYIIWFLIQRKKHPSPAVKVSHILLVLGYGILLVSFLYPHLGQLKIPVFLYALVISLMLLSTLSFPLRSETKPFLISGAIWFILSDSLLAINKFALTIPFASPMIRFSYAMAQFLIVAAIIRYRNKQGDVNLGT